MGNSSSKRRNQFPSSALVSSTPSRAVSQSSGSLTVTRIQLATVALARFVASLHTDGQDRGMICTFGSNFQVQQGFTASQAGMMRGVSELPSQVGGCTRLYDSVTDAITYFRNNGRRDRPWILIVITDGHDNRSSQSVAQCAARATVQYTHEDSNHCFVLGVGDPNEVNYNELVQLRSGGILTIPVQAFQLLERIFLMIAFQVIGVNITERGQLTEDISWERVRQLRAARFQPIDYGFVVDVSSSMNENVHLG